MSSFSLTPRQQEAQQVLAGEATHIMLFGGSRSGKTFLLTRNVVMRALKAPGSRHAILRFRFNAVKTAIGQDTLPRVMSTAFAGVPYKLSKSDWFVEFDNGSQIWLGGLDDKERVEKILGTEYATLYFNECSQIPESSKDTALTRLAQKVEQQIVNRSPTLLKPRAYYACNPPSKAHWSYRQFVLKQDAERRELKKPADYACFRINPGDNAANISADYLAQLDALPSRLKRRFADGEWAEATPNALWTDEIIDRWRVVDQTLPDMQRVVVAVDPSGADNDDAPNDDIGIVVCGLGTDGVGYVLEDLTVKCGPAAWGRIVASAYDRHMADCVVAEANYGGAMVKHVIQTARPKTPYTQVTASRGKAVRAEPISALFETGKARICGYMRELEDELMAFSTAGYTGEKSPNRADAMVWGLSALFPGMVKAEKKEAKRERIAVPFGGGSGWMV